MTSKEAFLLRMKGLADMVPGFLLSKELLTIYDMQLAPLGYENVCRALDEIICTRGSRDPFPSVAEIRHKIMPVVDDETQAIEIAGRIAEAVVKDGHVNLTRAKERIGELGWQVVQMSGGWLEVCSLESARDLNIAKAQWRKDALAVLARRKAGGRPELPPPTGQGAPKRIADIMARLPDMPGSGKDGPKGRAA